MHAFYFLFIYLVCKGHFTKPLLTSTVLEAVAKFILVCWSSLWRHHFPRMSTNWCVQSILHIFHICRCGSKQRIDIYPHDWDAEEHAHHREKTSPYKRQSAQNKAWRTYLVRMCVGVCVCGCWGIAGDGVGGARRVYTVFGDTCQNHQIHSSDKLASHFNDYSMLQMTAILFDLIRKKLCLSVSHCASLPSFYNQKNPQANCFFHLLSHITPQQILRTLFFLFYSRSILRNFLF